MHTQLTFVSDSGDICALLKEGIHPGGKIVSGSDWHGPVYNPTFRILDIHQDVDALRQAIVKHMTSSTDASTLCGYFGIDVSLLPGAVESDLNVAGRADVTLAEVLAATVWVEDMDEDTFNQRESGEDIS
jgi:hypothetical protein